MGGYFLRQAWRNLYQNPWLNTITLGTVVLSFLLLGIFLVIFLNARGLMAEWGSRIRVTAYLSDAVGTGQVKKMQEKISSFEEVAGVDYRSKDEALKALEGSLGSRQGLLKGLVKNPLPASLEIQLKGAYQNSAGVQSLASKLRGTPGIEELQFGTEWVKRFSAFLALLQALGLGLGGLLILAAAFVVSNTIRLSIFARREEIEIMRCVGATSFFVRAPFYVEGVLQGLLGASLSVALLFGVFRLFLSQVYDPLQRMLGDFTLHFLTAEQVVAMALGGVILGFLGTQASVGRYLRV